MQKIQKKAYILLWSIFLSLTISIAFISISTQINKNLKENNNIKEKIKINSFKKNKINEAIETNNFENININENEIIVFEKNNYYSIGLKDNSEIAIKIINSGNMTIKVNNGSPISYINDLNSNINGVIIDKKTFLTGNGQIIIKNLGGYSNIDIISEENFETSYKKYKVIKKIGDRNITREIGLIKNF